MTSEKSKQQQYAKTLHDELINQYFSPRSPNATVAGAGPTLRYALRAVYRIALTASGVPITSSTGTLVYGQEELDYDIDWLHLLIEEANDAIPTICPKVQPAADEPIPDTQRSESGGEQLRLRDEPRADGEPSDIPQSGGQRDGGDQPRVDGDGPGRSKRANEDHPASVQGPAGSRGFTRR